MACRVELRDLPYNASWQEREVAFAEAGILHDFKEHESYESPGQKRRRKNKESDNQRLKVKLRENFPERYKPKKEFKNRADK
jgi:ribosomal protein S21